MPAFTRTKTYMFPPRHGDRLLAADTKRRRANHIGVFRDSGLEVKHYRYYDKKNINLDLNGMIEDIKVLNLVPPR